VDSESEVLIDTVDCTRDPGFAVRGSRFGD
jgi:hypothetical protein